MSSAQKRFASFTEEEIQEKKRALQPKNTVRSNMKCVRMFQEFLSESGKDPDMLKLSNAELDSELSKFWFCARKQKQTTTKSKSNQEKENPSSETHYTATSLDHIRHGLKRYLQVSKKKKQGCRCHVNKCTIVVSWPADRAAFELSKNIWHAYVAVFYVPLFRLTPTPISGLVNYIPVLYFSHILHY